MLPVFAISLVWNRLQHPPATGDSTTDAKLSQLAEYFTSTWIDGDFPPSLWSHYDNPGPRTTNHAEGFHSSLNCRFGISHPSLRSFFHWMQRAQYEVQCRITQLDSGRPARRRQTAYVTNDANLWSAKMQYSVRIGSIFSCLFPHPHAWEQFFAASEMYLRHCSHMLSC